MKRYICSLVFSCKDVLDNSLINTAVSLPGFLPGPMDIDISNKEFYENTPFDESDILYAVKKGFRSLRIMNKDYDELPGFFWLRVELERQWYNTLTIEWLNESLDFLLNDSLFTNLLQSEYFICGYAVDYDDSYIQSNKDVRYLRSHMPGHQYKTKKEFGDEVIDTSENWGRIESACGLEFAAAPLTWFGQLYFKIISKEKLLQFEYSGSAISENGNIVSIKLFDLYDSPEKPENRLKQKEFWKYFNLQQVADNYRTENEFDAAAHLRNMIIQANTKKKKK